MGTKTDEIAVYPVSVFNASQQSFWFGSLDRILEKYPFLEHPHKHIFYMLLYVEKANGTAMLDNQCIRLDEAKVISIKPNSVFSLDINRSAKGFIICFTEGFFSLRYNNNVLYQFTFLKKEATPFVRLSANQTERWNTLLGLMLEEITSAHKHCERVLRSYVNILLFDLERKLHNHKQIQSPNSKEAKIILFEKNLEEHYAVQKSPSFYAKKLNITTNYLNKLCHDYRGVTGSELIRKRVVIEAQRLLFHTSLTVAEIAFKLGFESPSYFITFFKKQTQTTPEHFRKNHY